MKNYKKPVSISEFNEYSPIPAAAAAAAAATIIGAAVGKALTSKMMGNDYHYKMNVPAAIK
ncbi:hypothetical protein IKO70_10330 [bacterium]|nr:hypothetical protein [bacterium]